MAITEQVQVKLDQNITEGFALFEKVQQLLKNAEEQLREVGALGHSINDYNNLLKLPRLRGQFARAWNGSSLTSRPHMSALPSSPGRGRLNPAGEWHDGNRAHVSRERDVVYMEVICNRELGDWMNEQHGSVVD